MLGGKQNKLDRNILQKKFRYFIEQEVESENKRRVIK